MEKSLTERLYYRDPYLCVFDAVVIERCQVDDRQGVVLDCTAFYPTGGGQPHDIGTLDGIPVVDVQVMDGGKIVHLLDGPLEGTDVHGEVNWQRRFDHMQQHTGQHILSQAFSQVCQVETVGFHLGDAVCTVDFDAAHLAPEQLVAAEKLANQVVIGSHPVVARFVDRTELAGMPLRKMPVVDGPIRIVQISQFDWSPCGGTHVENTGQVGPIKVVRVERRRKLSRVYFLCGWRAISDYTHKQEIVHGLTAHLTTSEDELLPSVERMETESKNLLKALLATRMQVLEYEISDWIAQAERIGGVHVVVKVLQDWDIALLRESARRLTQQSGIVALLAARQPRAQFVFARSKNVSLDMGQLMHTACAAASGRGGGRPHFAQGGAPGDRAAEQVLQEALAQLKTSELELVDGKNCA